MLGSDDLVGIGMAAHQLCLKKNDPRVVTYQIDRNITYTNFCTEYCSFCAFYSPLGSKDGYILCFAEVSEISIRETIQRLMDAGLQSIPGGGAEILDDEVRAKIARLKCTSDDWEEMHRVAHSLGLRTTATMMFGCGEELRHRVNHLERLRHIPEDTGGFTAFIPWVFATENTALGKKVQEATAVDYLKTLAVSRLYLDNFDHIQSSWLTPAF